MAVWEGHWQCDFTIIQESVSHLRIIGVLQAIYRVTLSTKNTIIYWVIRIFFFCFYTVIFFCSIMVLCSPLTDLKKQKCKN